MWVRRSDFWVLLPEPIDPNQNVAVLARKTYFFQPKIMADLPTDPRRLEWLEAQCNRRLASAVEFTKIKPLAAPRESAHARKLRCPYRDTLLSKLLADMFLSPKHRVAVVSTLSPSATDV